MRAQRFAFVMEQTLGHVAHTRNLERALAITPGVDGAVFRLPFEPVPPVPILRNWTLRSSLMARRALQRGERPDAAFIHTQVAALLSVGFMHAVPTVVSLDATPRNFDAVGEAYGHREGGALAEVVKLRLNRRSLLAATALVTWTRLAAGSLVEDYGIPAGRVHVIPPGVDLELFRPPEGVRPAGPVRVLFVGGDFARKGGLDLLAAMEALPEAELDVVTGSEVGEVPRGVRVHRGLRPGDEALLDLYRRADIFALPSRGDCLPQALAEAAAAGLPLVATSTGAVSEIVQEGRNGLLVPVGSVPRLSLALRQLVMEAGLREAMGRESMAIASREHDAMANHRRIFELMADIAMAGRPAVHRVA